MVIGVIVIAARFLDQERNIGVKFVCLGDLHHFLQQGLVLNHGEMPFLLIQRAGSKQSRLQDGIQCINGYLPGGKLADTPSLLDDAYYFIRDHRLSSLVHPDRLPAWVARPGGGIDAVGRTL